MYMDTLLKTITVYLQEQVGGKIETMVNSSALFCSQFK